MSAKSLPDTHERLGRFDVVRRLGEGGEGRVRLVRDPRQAGTLCALKIGPPRAEGRVLDEGGSALLAEARVLGALLHPGVPRIFEVGRFEDGVPWLLMEYVAPPAEPPDPVDFVRGALDAIAYLHRHGWLHHDLKPANVLAGEGGRVVIVDFGLATREHETVLPRGTLPFVAPEVLAGERADARSDLWSFAAGLLQRFGSVRFPPNASLGPGDVPDDFPLPAGWMRRLLHRRPEHRCATAEEALAEFCEVAGIATPTVSRLPLPHAPVPVGRRTELRALEKRLDELGGARIGDTDPNRRRSVGVALLHGQSGVGKSHLLAEFRLRALAREWGVYMGSCAQERDAPLPAFGSVLQSVLEDAPDDSAAVQKRGNAVSSLLAARSDRDGPETAARFLLERAAETSGLVLLIEDLQAASALTLRVLTAISRAILDAVGRDVPPRLFLITTLMEGTPPPEELAETLVALEAEGVLFRIPLRPLSPQDVTELVRGVLGDAAPAERVAEVLRQHGGALPLFAEGLLDRLVQSHALRYDGGRWILDDHGAPALPQNLLMAVRGRLNETPPKELQALQLMAAYERPLPTSLATRLLGADAKATLSALQARGLIVPAMEGRAAAIAHAMISQAALTLLPRRLWPRLHDRVAACLPKSDPNLAIRRAYHVARGSDRDAGFQAATVAARRLRAEGEPGRAADFVRQGLRLLDDNDPRVPLVRRSLADLLVTSGRPEAAANVYRDLITGETDRLQQTRLRVALAEALDLSGAAGRVVECCDAALGTLAVSDLHPDSPEAVGLRLTLLARLAGALRATGDLRRAIERVKEALPLAGPGRAGERAALLSLLGNIYLQMGDMERARKFHEACLTAARGAGSRRNVAAALHNLGVVHAHRGEREDAGRCYRQALRLSMRAKDLQGVAQTLGNMANLKAEEGDFAGAEALQFRSLSIRRRIGDAQGVAITQGNMACLKRARGRLGSALSLLQEAIKQLRRLGDAAGEVQFLVHSAAIHLFANDPQGARPLLLRALTRSQDASLRSLEARAEMLLGRLERRTAPDGDEWPKRLARARRLFEHGGDRSGLAEARLETALGERDRGRRGVAMREWRAAEALLVHGGSPDVKARLMLVRGRLESDRVPGREALEALEGFDAYARSCGRRDYRVAAGLALARARLALGDRNGARRLLVETRQIEEDLAASLPPTLRRSREAGAARVLLAELERQVEAQETEAPPSESEKQDEMEQDRLLKLLAINKELNQATDMRALLGRIMDVATEMTGAERGFLILIDNATISFQVARNFKREEVRKPELQVSRSIVERVIKSGAAILTDNATEDQRFSEFKSVDRLELKSIVSIPFRVGDEVIGAMYLDNPAQKGVFGPGDLQFLTALGDQAALAIRNLRHAQLMAATNEQLEQNLVQKEAQLEQASRALAERATKYPYEEIIGRSQAMRKVLLLVDKVVDTEVPVLIQGESGTGKELIARAIHMHGPRKSGTFVPVNCGAIAATLMESELFGHVKGAFTGAHETKKGLFTEADGGTIFLDEIGEMDIDLQKKLLRVLQEQEVRAVGAKNAQRVNVRVIAATNRNLREMMNAGTFRQDLYYRIAVINVDLPPLRDRSEDIPELVDYFIESASKNLGLTRKEVDADAMAALQSYEWPGNVRELDNEVKKALTLSDERITLSDLSQPLQGEGHTDSEPQLVDTSEGRTLKESLEATEKRLIERALEKTGGNQTRAAKELGISRVWLRKKMEKYDLLQKR